MRSTARQFVCHSSALAFAAVVWAALPGCNTVSQYTVVAPGASRGPVTPNAGAIITRDKIDYELFQADNKVVVHFVNRTGQPLHLTEASAIFDVSGRSFAVEPQDAAPDQAGRVLLPPAFAVDQARPAPIATEVRVGGVDEGGSIGSRRDIELNDAAGGSLGGAAAPAPGFRWPVNGQVRLRLVYRIGTSEADLTHDWTIRRTQ